MNWYLENGKDSDVIFSSRIRFARNLKKFPFKIAMSNKDKLELLEKVKFITPSLGYGLKFLYLNDIDDITKMTLVEKHIVSPDFVLENDEKAILINDEENICIMINEEDHLRIQVFSSGLDIKNTLNLAIELDEKLDKLLDFSYNEKYGFLTACPTNIGTGLKASVMVHLPALRITGNLNKILHIVNSFGMTIRGLYGEDSKSQSDIYQISNIQTLGIEEKDIVLNLENITRKVVEQERLARKYLTKNAIDLEDKICRSYGILANARKMSVEECNSLLSDIKLGTDLGILDDLNDTKVKKIMLYTKPANLQKTIGKVLDVSQKDKERTQIIRKILKEQ